MKCHFFPNISILFFLFTILCLSSMNDDTKTQIERNLTDLLNEKHNATKIKMRYEITAGMRTLGYSFVPKNDLDVTKLNIYAFNADTRNCKELDCLVRFELFRLRKKEEPLLLYRNIFYGDEMRDATKLVVFTPMRVVLKAGEQHLMVLNKNPELNMYFGQINTATARNPYIYYYDAFTSTRITVKNPSRILGVHLETTEIKERKPKKFFKQAEDETENSNELKDAREKTKSLIFENLGKRPDYKPKNIYEKQWFKWACFGVLLAIFVFCCLPCFFLVKKLRKTEIDRLGEESQSTETFLSEQEEEKEDDKEEEKEEEK